MALRTDYDCTELRKISLDNLLTRSRDDGMVCELRARQ
jgi:hypothetical protein